MQLDSSAPDVALASSGTIRASGSMVYTIAEDGTVLTEASSATREVADRHVAVLSGTTVRTGETFVQATDPSGSLLWKRALGARIVGTPMMTAAGRILVAAESGLVLSLTDDGRADWTLDTGEPLGFAARLWLFGTMLIPATSGKLLSISTGTGKLRWKAQLGATPNGPAELSTRGEAFIGTAAGLEAYSARGERLWTVARPGGSTSPAVGKVGKADRLYAIDGEGVLLALDPAGQRRAGPTTTGGAPIWSTPLSAPAAASPVVDLDGVVYAATADGKLHAVADEGNTAAPRWTVDLGAKAAAPPVIAPGGALYAPLEDGAVVAIGRPLSGHGKLCATWSAQGRGCPAACTTCAEPFDRCTADPGCERIARCAVATGCSTANRCSLPSTCRSAIDAAGGLGSESFRRAVALGRCSAQACVEGGIR